MDRVTVRERISKDDVSVMSMLGHASLPQILEYIKIATENNVQV